MKVLEISFFILAIAIITTIAKKTDDEEWEEFKKKHGKKNKDPKEEAKRKAFFLKAQREIEAHNLSNKTWQLAHNQFSDRSPEEKKSVLGYIQHLTRSAGLFEISMELSLRQTPSSVDYRNDSCLGPVKDQGYCGSCWAFAALAPLEFQLCKYHEEYISLSEQHLVNCACNGCGGGNYHTAWTHLTNTSSGSVSSIALPYNSSRGICQELSSGLTKPVFQWTVPSAAPSIMRVLRHYGPLSVAMHVNSTFFYYKSGVYDAYDCPDTVSDLNHAMVIVGYGTDTVYKLDYWIVRNSWGSSWGSGGYFLVRRGVNRCGIESNVALVISHPTIV